MAGWFGVNNLRKEKMNTEYLAVFQETAQRRWHFWRS